MGVPISSVLIKHTSTLTLTTTATGRQVVRLPTLQSRGQIVGLKVRQAIGGVITTASFFLADGAAVDLTAADPPDEYVALKAAGVTMTPSATAAALDLVPAQPVTGVMPSTSSGNGFYYSATQGMALAINITAVSAATASTLIIDVISQVQK